MRGHAAVFRAFGNGHVPRVASRPIQDAAVAQNAPVAQPDRVVASEAIGRGFESLQARHLNTKLRTPFAVNWHARSGKKRLSRRGFDLNLHRLSACCWTKACSGLDDDDAAASQLQAATGRDGERADHGWHLLVVGWPVKAGLSTLDGGGGLICKCLQLQRRPPSTDVVFADSLPPRGGSTPPATCWLKRRSVWVSRSRREWRSNSSRPGSRAGSTTPSACVRREVANGADDLNP